jgi:protein TonB
MELRALLFTADGSSAATLCEVLTELGIQAEICSEMLVASERISREPYDAILVDWDNEVEAGFLLKKAREQRVFSLNLALVPNEAAIARALQHGANSVIRKPINVAQASETLTTARDLILSRHAEQREKQARLSALEAEAEPLDDAPVEVPLAPKTGFLQQNMTRTAFEAEQKINRTERPAETGWQAARGPASIHRTAEPEAREVEPITKKRWDDVKTIFREDGETEKEKPDSELPRSQSQDATGVFSSMSDDAEYMQPGEEEETSSPPQYLVFAVVACVLIAGVLYVWAPGDSYLGRMNSAFHAFSVKGKASAAKPAATPAPPQPEKPATQVAAAPKPEELLMADPPAESTDVDPSKIQIIETKTVPKAGAQQPPSNDPPPDSDHAKALAQATAHGAWPDATPAAQAETQAAAPPLLPPAPSAPAPRPAPAPAPNRVPEDAMPSPEARTAVIIPDSLRSTPAPSPASNLEPFTVPEATALALLIHRVEPQYPAQALGQHLQGPVVLQASVGKDGIVRDVKLVTGYFVLGRAAFDAVRQWRFKPFVQDGRAIDFQTSITLNFRYPS